MPILQRSILVMKNRSLPFFAFLFFGFFLLSCGSVKEPELKGIENVRVDRFGLKESNLFLDLRYSNPNNYRLKLKRAEGNAWLDGNPLGHFTVDTLIHIAGHSDFRLPVKMKMDMSHLLQNVSAVLLGKEVTLKIDGMARIGKGFVFINYHIHYEGKQNLGDLLK